MNKRVHTNDAGQATAFLIVMAAALLLLVAFVLDVGAALSERNRNLQVAQEAARAGAQQIDLATYRTEGTVDLDPGSATAAAEEFLADAGVQGSASVEGDVVTVTARTTFTFRLLPVGSRTASGAANATPVTDADPISP